ncbi:6-hydroxy-D-nicotine oxidase [Xylariaceae sp. FL1019]|nr:6-hydroxy-D-nicotine oxidase [Xylariaceae sp. FL1019]
MASVITRDIADKVAVTRQALQAKGLSITTAAQTSEYAVEQQTPWSQACWLPSACYVRPQSPDEVTATLAILKENGVVFAVRSTGHNPIPKVSSVDQAGILIDLQNLNHLSLGEDGTVQVGGGAKWGDIYTFVEKRGRSIMGARNLGVGVGGYTLGGGMPAFPNLHGLPADNVKNFEVVLGNSAIVNANANTNSDLWKALKGGGTNFGIVTRFDIQTHPLIKTKYAVHVYDPVDYENILKATVQVQESMEDDPKIGLFVSFQPKAVAVGLLYADVPDEIPKAFQPFLQLSSLLTKAVEWTDGTDSTIKSLVSSIQFAPPSARRTQSATTMKVDLDLYIKAHRLYIEKLKTAVSDIFYTIQPLSSRAVQQGEEKGDNIMGIPKLAQNWWAGASSWHDASLDEAAFAEVDELRIAVEKAAEGQGMKLEYAFMNDASPIQTVLDTYGDANLKLMRDVSTRYDEEQVFQKLQNGGYLLRNIA